MYAYAQRLAVVLGVLAFVASGRADIIVNYSIDAGGMNPYGIDGIAARSTWSIDGNQLSILLENTSTAIPIGFEIPDSLLVSLGFNLPNLITMHGDAAVIGQDSIGLGKWDARGAGDTVAEEWLWTNQAGGDLLKDYFQVISTSMGVGGGDRIKFNGQAGGVNGPFGGIATNPVLLNVPKNKAAVSNGILFLLTLDVPLTEAQLLGVAQNSIVEFGSDFQYLSVPTPGTIGLLLAAAIIRPRRRRRER